MTFRFVALTLACLMFITSVSFVVDLHYCQGQLKSFSLIGKARTCHTMSPSTPMQGCPYHKKMMVEKEDCMVGKKKCCSNKTLHFNWSQDRHIQTYDFSVSRSLQQFVFAYLTVFFDRDFTLERETSYRSYYKPPLLSKDIPVLFESFLI